MVVHGLAPVPSHLWATAFFFCSLALLASFTLGPISYVLPPGCRLFFLARGAATGLGATAPGADVSAASWAAWPGWLEPRHTLSPEHHLLCLPILLLQQPLGEEACASDGNWRLASLSWRFSVSGRLPRLEPQCQVCGVVGNDAWFLFWAVHTLEEWQEALTQDTSRLNDSGCLCFCVALVSIC